MSFRRQVTFVYRVAAARARPWLVLGVAALLLESATPAAARTRVWVVLVDGLNAASVGEQSTPTLWTLAHGGGDRATYYRDGQAVMPTVTNTNHAALLTASYPAANGIIGNKMSDRTPGHAPFASESARYLDVETVFTVAEREHPELVTAALFGKSRLVGMFTAVPERQVAPDILWGDMVTETEGIDPKVGFASDHRTMDEAVRTVYASDPDLLFVALPDVDRTEHLFGPDSFEARRAILAADNEIGRLIKVAKARATWAETVFIVTADHGMQSVAPDPAKGRPYPLVLFGRELLRNGYGDLIALSRGSIESIFLPAPAPDVLDGADAERLAGVRRLALAQPEVAEALYRLPNPRDGGSATTLATLHPDWRFEHPQVGELVLVARPNCQFGDPFEPSTAGVLGNHGGAEQRAIPIIVAGGDPRVRAQVIDTTAGATTTAANPDIGATALWLLGLRAPRAVAPKEAPVPSALAGRVLREAFAP